MDTDQLTVAIAQATVAISQLVRAVDKLRGQLELDHAFRKSSSCVVTKEDLERTERNIMSAISEWVGKLGPRLDRIQTGLDAVQALVEKLQNSPGAFTPEDQALVDQIDAKVDAIANDADSTPPAPPV